MVDLEDRAYCLAMEQPHDRNRTFEISSVLERDIDTFKKPEIWDQARKGPKPEVWSRDCTKDLCPNQEISKLQKSPRLTGILVSKP